MATNPLCSLNSIKGGLNHLPIKYGRPHLLNKYAGIPEIEYLYEANPSKLTNLTHYLGVYAYLPVVFSEFNQGGV